MKLENVIQDLENIGLTEREKLILTIGYNSGQAFGYSEGMMALMDANADKLELANKGKFGSMPVKL